MAQDLVLPAPDALALQRARLGPAALATPARGRLLLEGVPEATEVSEVGCGRGLPGTPQPISHAFPSSPSAARCRPRLCTQAEMAELANLTDMVRLARQKLEEAMGRIQ